MASNNSQNISVIRVQIEDVYFSHLFPSHPLHFIVELFLHPSLGVRFQTTHVPNMKRKYTVTGLARESADLHRFDVEDERTKTSRRMSVTEYFRDRYKYNLR